jgi:hypothetical protein
MFETRPRPFPAANPTSASQAPKKELIIGEAKRDEAVDFWGVRKRDRLPRKKTDRDRSAAVCGSAKG